LVVGGCWGGGGGGGGGGRRLYIAGIVFLANSDKWKSQCAIIMSATGLFKLSSHDSSTTFYQVKCSETPV